jgi:formamidopyrimidine-DNA glycosylase
MPELPEVHTTATMLDTLVRGHTITDVWTSYRSPTAIRLGRSDIKNPKYFKTFANTVIGTSIVRVHRRAKNVLIDLSNNQTLLVHMKMTGHLLYGTYKQNKNSWIALEPEALKDPFNRFIRLVFTFDNGRHLALCDMRKFAKVTLHHDIEEELGPEPLEKEFTLQSFIKQLSRRPNMPIKQALMDQSLIAGIGNIYSDEILWATGVHPLSKTGAVLENKNITKKMFTRMKDILSKGISFGGDSTSDYRNPHGVPGAFQYHHRAYRRTSQKCPKRGCSGTIRRIIVSGRSAHFCDVHQVKI